MRYRYNDGVNINYNNPEMYKHFIAIIKKLNRYKLLKLAYDNISAIYLDDNNFMKTSYYDNEENTIHLLKSQLNLYTVAHELGHKLQEMASDVVSYLHPDNFEITTDLVQKYYDRYIYHKTIKGCENKEVAIAILDIINSWTKGNCSVLFHHPSHNIQYYENDEEIAMQECLSNMWALKVSKNNSQEIKEFKKDFAPIIREINRVTKEIEEQVIKRAKALLLI